MQAYLSFLEHILNQGQIKADRTHTGVLSIFGYQMRLDLSQGFPLLTTKKLHIKSIIHELLWFIQGKTNIKDLNQVGVTIWNEWADANGELGPIYGKQWRRWLASDGQIIDQLSHVIDQIQFNPDSRRLIVSAWNVGELEQMALPPCHVLFQFYVLNGRLSCQVYQRSADAFLGVPFNLASYALLTHIIAHQCHLQAGELIWVGGDCHLYLNHVDFAKQQLTRKPHDLPQLEIQCTPKSITEYQFEDFKILDYYAHPSIRAPIAV